ncbi:pilus assembly PilX family protein [Salinicola halophilus]|uniref:pilus assembly PilX family protein n=1 Tax=Salinicola halophilus TaxID=184065 RepID=UPI000DA1370E|nr:PilX N-terminal domain-containing pilus assembly protein [Salinicola halophilus]
MIGPSQQRGAALLVTLVLVALISLLTLGASETARLQQRLASNELAHQMAFQAAEAALKDAERRISETADLTLFCSGGDAVYPITTQAGLEDDDRWRRLEQQGRAVDLSLYSVEGSELAPPPRYLVGCIAPALIDGYFDTEPVVKGQASESANPRYFFRVFAIGYGPAGQARQRLEARYVF